MKSSRFPNSERGGGFTVSGYLALALLALCAAETAYAVHLLRHRNIVINFGGNGHTPRLPPTRIHGSDEYRTHTFPEGRAICSGFDTICYIRI